MKKKNFKVTSDVPSRASVRIKTNAEIKQEPADEESKAAVKKVNLKKPVIKPKGKAVQAATSVKEKAKKIVSSKRRRESQHSTRINPKMTVLALAAARKRKLNGEDDEEAPRKRVPRKPQKKKVRVTKKKVSAKPVPLDGYCLSEYPDEVTQDEEVFEEEQYEEQQTMIAIKQEDGHRDEQDEVHYEEEFEDNEDNNLLIHEEHQYIDHMDRNHIVDDHSEIEVPQEQVQAELQDELNEDDEDEQDDDEDIDENLFFGIPEQRSPDLATCTHCKGKFRKEDVHEHMLTCPERYVQCRECGKILSNLQTLERHHKRFHLKIREVPCTLCDKMFIDEAAARKHLKTVHFKVKNFHCPHCDKSFSQRNKLTYHVRTHSGEKPYSCAECGRSFSLLWNLKTHLRTHTGEKPYACDTCGRRFTQKQNMTSHLTTHRKPKSDKSFRAQFQSELDEYDSNASEIMSADFSSVKPKNNFRAMEQAKQLGTQTIGSNHYVLGDMQSIEVHTADDQTVDHSVNLEHGLGLLSSVARKGDSTDVQVDGIVNIPENQLTATGGNLDQVVEVLIRSNVETDKSGNPMNSFQFANSGQSKIILDPHTQAITDGDGQEITMDTNTAAGLANILQNPDVLAAINSAASTNKFIVIGPVNMFDGSVSNASLSSANSITNDATSNLSQEQLAQISSIVAAEQNIDASQVSSQTVNDSISATTALAAVENYFQGDEQPSSSLNKVDEVVTNILSSIQPDGKRGPSAVLQSANSSMPRSANLTIAMPPMPQSTLIISPSTLSINVDSTHGMKTIFPSSVKPLVLPNSNVSSSSEVSSSVDHVNNRLRFNQPQHSSEVEGHMEAESTTEADDFGLVNHNAENIEQSYVQSNSPGLADSSDMVSDSAGNEATSSVEQEPILMLINDENGQPQIIVKMPDGTETIMSDPALAESLIQVPTITNADMDCDTELNEAEPSQSMVINQMGGTIHLQLNDQDQLPDQGIPQTTLLPNQSDLQTSQLTNESDLQPTQSGLHSQSFSPNSQSVRFQLNNEAEASHRGISDVHQLPDQSSVPPQHDDIDSTYPTPNDDVDSAYNQIASTYSSRSNDYGHENVVDSAYSPEGDVVDSAYHCDEVDSAYPPQSNNVDSGNADESVDSRMDEVNSVNDGDSIIYTSGDNVNSVNDADSLYSGRNEVDSVNNNDALFTTHSVDSVNDADSLYSRQDHVDSVNDADSVYSGNDNADSANDADSVYARSNNVDSAHSRHDNDADSSSNVNVLESNIISDTSIEMPSDSTIQTPDSSSQSSRRIMAENHIDSRQAIFVMEHVSASDQPEQSHISTQSREINEEESTNFMADSSSGSENVGISETYYLQLSDVTQSSHFQETSSGLNEVQIDSENVSSSEQ